ncbi:MAG: four helix bundle protein [Thermoflexales bacterium]|nr:four helix bundle protein [Thermoflexales bacterium]
MRYEEWERAVPEEIKRDSLWKMQAYRLALFLGDLAWHDALRLAQEWRMIGLADQLYQAVGSISANLAEGYSRGSGRDRARFYEYALGSARESRDWYFKCRHVLGDGVFQHRMHFLTSLVRLILTMVPQQRGAVLQLRDASPVYRLSDGTEIPEPENVWDSAASSWTENWTPGLEEDPLLRDPSWSSLLTDVPLPD